MSDTAKQDQLQAIQCHHDQRRGLLLSSPPQYLCEYCGNTWVYETEAPVCPILEKAFQAGIAAAVEGSMDRRLAVSDTADKLWNLQVATYDKDEGDGKLHRYLMSLSITEILKLIATEQRRLLDELESKLPKEMYSNSPEMLNQGLVDYEFAAHNKVVRDVRTIITQMREEIKK